MATINLPDTVTDNSQTLQNFALAGETILAGQPVMLYTDGKLYVASANNGKYFRVDGISLNGAKVGQRCWYALPDVELTVSGLTLGDTYYLAPGTNEVQTLTITGIPTGGTVTISFLGVSGAPIVFNASAAAVQAALELISTVGAGNVLGAGGPWPGTAITITFRNLLGGDNQAMLVKAANNLTGGTSPDLTIAETTPGARGGGLAPRADLTTGHYLSRLGTAKATTLFKFEPYFISQL